MGRSQAVKNVIQLPLIGEILTVDLRKHSKIVCCNYIKLCTQHCFSLHVTYKSDKGQLK